MFASVDDVVRQLRAKGYFATRDVATGVHLALEMGKPLFVEGAVGTGKTALAHAMAAALGTRLIRLQCFPGIDIRHGVYEWNVAKQVLRLHNSREPADALQREIFTEPYLISRPVLEAITAKGTIPPLLLIDELDRAGDDFEGFLFALLKSYEVHVPELGVIRAVQQPVVVVTCDLAREVHASFKRICQYVWMDYPAFEVEVQVLMARAPGMTRGLAGELCNVVERLRDSGLRRPPGVAESVAWARAMVALRRTSLDATTLDATLGCLVSNAEDMRLLRAANLASLLTPAVDRAA